MLKLKKLQILGFKSFCDRTELKFHGEGVAAIVGPNGCGKSNISDAITWVLGEQSAKSLRGARMEDVIFAGTRDRKPTGMAEVTLTLVDPDVYEGADIGGTPEMDIQDEMTASDWDEAARRAASAEEVEQYTEEVRPGPADEHDEHAEGAESASTTGAATAPAATPEAHRIPGFVDSLHAQHVVLKIRRRKFKTQVKKGEIMVTRRLFRSGESEYLLNGKLCRLRDIQDIFMGTGLGPESYAIIEQGRIGQILSSKPTDRRNILEEAAGITKFKTRKRLAEARLEDSKANLSRVNDIFDEVTRQMNSLKRQAAKAERYAKLRDEMRAKLRLVLASKFTDLAQHATELETLLAQLTEELHLKGEAVQQMDVEHTERTQRGYAIENESKLTRGTLNSVNLEMDRATARTRHNEERCAELTARCAGAEAEITQTAEQLTRLQAELDSNQQVLESAAADVAAAQEQLRQRQEEARAAATALADVERQQEQQRRQMMETVSAASHVRNRITQAEERIAALDRESQRLHAETTTANQQVETFGGQRGQVTFEFESSSQRVTAITEQIVAARLNLESKRNAESEGKKHLDQMRSEFATFQGKRASLEAVIAEHGYSTDSVRRLFQSGAMQGGAAPAGVLADFLEVEDKYEHVVDDFLRDELNYIVVKSWDSADQGMNLLRHEVDGRATFLVHPSDSQARFSFVVDESTHQKPTRDYPIVPLKDCIRVLNGFGKSLEFVLPKLGNGFIVPDATTGRDLALENPDAFFLAQSGECFHNVTVTGGKQRSEGPLSMKRELRDVQRNLNDLERALRDQETRVALLGREIGEITQLLDRLEADKRESEKQAMTSGHSLRQLESEMQRVRERLTTYERELQRVASERAERDTFIQKQREELVTVEERQVALEISINAAQENLATLRVSRDTAADASSEVLARVAGLEERRRSADASLSRIQSMLAEVNQRVNSLRAQIESAIAEKAQREQENENLAAKLVEWAEQKQVAEAREAELQSESEQVRARLAELEEQLKTARIELDAVRDHRGEVSAKAAKLQSDVEHMAETCIQELSTTRDELLADETLVRVTGEELATEDAAYREMRTRLENMGPVNMMALEEYKETAQRHEFLETQRKDLLEAIENTQNTIKEIDAISRQKFEEAFHAINENFKRTFSKLFGGGAAFMKLTDEENSAESGIDIIASPPGKKLQNVLLLSGGEKALTAFSLLVGIFQYQPSPFCILDEVDAPLDEANIGRFTELVREMSAQTQFVIITHSKKTMSIAPVMYGVTMQEPGVSKIVSVRFGDHNKPQMERATA